MPIDFEQIIANIQDLAIKYGRFYQATNNRYYQGRSRGYRDAIVMLKRHFNIEEGGLQIRQ